MIVLFFLGNEKNICNASFEKAENLAKLDD